MPADPRTTVVHRLFALAIPIVIAVWVVTPATVTATSSSFALLALLTALAWIVTTTYKNARPAASLARARHGADRPGSATTERRSR